MVTQVEFERQVDSPGFQAEIARVDAALCTHAATPAHPPDLYEKYRVSVPEGRAGPWRIERFLVTQRDARMSQLRATLNPQRNDRSVSPGWHTGLYHDERGVIMSDTRSEVIEHLDAIWRIQLPTAQRVLVHGLGLGMILRVALMQEHVRWVDVVELDHDVISLTAPHYEEMDDQLQRAWGVQYPEPRFKVHHANAYTHRFRPGTRWDVCWHDVWDTISTDNLPRMERLHRRYGGRCGWQGSWAKDQCQAAARQGGGGW
jgi:hypothetical protein